MTMKVYINGVVCDPDDAHISVFDRGFLYGDSIYLQQERGDLHAVRSISDLNTR